MSPNSDNPLVTEDDGIPVETDPVHRALLGDAEALSEHLRLLRLKFFPPSSLKQLRKFTTTEAARLIGVSDSYIRKLRLGEGLEPDKGTGGKLLYTLAQINNIRQTLSEGRDRSFFPRRQAGEHLQVLTVANFKGGSGKTTTAAHLAQYLSLKGYRVLAVDLDPQGSLSALFGYQPELDVAENQTLYAAIRYDEERRPLRDVIRPTYFEGLDFVPAALELQEFEHATPMHMNPQSGVAVEDLFFARVSTALETVQADYDVVVMDCPPQLGFLTLSALCAASGLVVTVHPQMLDVSSMAQFLYMTSDLLRVVHGRGADLHYDFLRYLVTRFEPHDGPQTQVVALMRNLFGERVLTNAMLKSTAVSDAGLSKETLYEVAREKFVRQTYDRAIESLDLVNAEIEGLMHRAWGRKR